MLIVSDLSTVRRIAPFPYPVNQIGYSADETLDRQSFCLDNALEVCLRLSDAAGSIDTVEGKRYEMPLPHVFFKFPRRRFAYAGLSHRYAVHFRYDLETAARLNHQGLLPPPDRPYVILKSGGPIDGLIHRLLDLQKVSREPGSADRIDAVCFELLQEINFLRVGAVGVFDPDRAKIMAIASYLLLDNDRIWSLDEVIRRNGFSRRSFFRHWRNCFEVPPTVYVMRERLLVAAQQLADSDRRVSEIGRRLGIADPAYFSKVFKKHYGETPLQYRRSHGQPGWRAVGNTGRRESSLRADGAPPESDGG